MKRSRCSLLPALCLSLLGPVWADTAPPTGPVIDQLRSSGRIVIAHRESSIPFSFMVDGKPIGYAVDICHRLVEHLRSKLALPQLAVAYRMVTPANRIEVIEKSEAQLECGSTTNSAARRERVAFTVPHFITGARLLVKADSPIGEIGDPAIKRVVSNVKSTPLATLQRLKLERGYRYAVLETGDLESAVQMVERGEADAFAMDDVLLFGLAANRSDPKALRVTGKFLTTEPLAIMLPKQDPAFKKIIDTEMRRLILSRELYAVYTRWFEQPIPPRNQTLGLAMSYLLRDFWKYPTDQVP